MLTSAKLIRHFKKLLLMSSTNSFQYVPSSIAILHIVQNLRVVHFWSLLQIKYATPDDPSKIGLTSSPKKKLRQVELRWIQVSRHIKLTEKCKKACVAVLVGFIHIMATLIPVSLNVIILFYRYLNNGTSSSTFRQLEIFFIFDTWW